MPQFGVILAAAGQSSRFQDANYKKPFVPLAGRPVWLHAAEKFIDRDDVKQVIVVVAPEDREAFVEKFGASLAFMGITLAEGGASRADSVRNGLAKLSTDIDMVAIHDAARPCLAQAWIDRVFAAGAKTGAAILATPVVSTLKQVGADHVVTGTVDRTPALPPPPPRRAFPRPCRSPAPRRGRPRRGGRASGHRGARFTAQPQDHHPRGSAAGRAGTQGTARPETHRPRPSVRGRRPLAVMP